MRLVGAPFVLGALLVVAGCGGGGSSGATATNTPAPSPPPSPTPVPPPAPAPTPSPTGIINLAGATNGSVLQIRRACSSSRATYTGGTITGIEALGSVTLRDAETGRYLTGSERIEAFGDIFFVDPNATNRQFGQLESLSDFTMTVAKTMASPPPSATFGYTDRTTLCFFAAGLAPPSQALQVGYGGRVDGLAQSGAGVRRLYLSVAYVNVSTVTRSGTLTIELAGYSGAFPDLAAGTPVPIGTVTANLAFVGTQVSASGIVAPAGYTGTIAGELVGTDGMILVFEFRDPAGNVIWGAAALDNAACFGCWDY